MEISQPCHPLHPARGGSGVYFLLMSSLNEIISSSIAEINIIFFHIWYWGDIVSARLGALYRVAQPGGGGFPPYLVCGVLPPPSHPLFRLRERGQVAKSRGTLQKRGFIDIFESAWNMLGYWYIYASKQFLHKKR